MQIVTQTVSLKSDSYNEPRSVFEDLTQVTLIAE